MRATLSFPFAVVLVSLLAACEGQIASPVSALEICDDADDNDQNGITDCEDPACNTAPACLVPASNEICGDSQDNDQDGDTDCDDSECAWTQECQCGGEAQVLTKDDMPFLVEGEINEDDHIDYGIPGYCQAAQVFDDKFLFLFEGINKISVRVEPLGENEPQMSVYVSNDCAYDDNSAFCSVEGGVDRFSVSSAAPVRVLVGPNSSELRGKYLLQIDWVE
jgi:hypothetical protein